MDYAEYQLLADIDDELTALAENIARLQLIVEEMRSHALTGTRAVDQRCRAMTLEGHQCSNRATGRGAYSGFCGKHRQQASAGWVVSRQ